MFFSMKVILGKSQKVLLLFIIFTISSDVGEHACFLLVRIYIDMTFLEGNRKQSKLELQLLFNSTISFLGIYPRGKLTNM